MVDFKGDSDFEFKDDTDFEFKDGWSSAILTGINLETGEPHHVVGYTFGSRAKGFDTISGKHINHAIKIGEHIIIIN